MSCTVGKFEFDFFLMSHPHAAHSRVHLFAFCQSSAPGGQAVTWVPSGVGSFPINWRSVISGRPIRAISFERRWFSSEPGSSVGGEWSAIISVGPTELKMWE